jgi:NaMN:DMB phosphoribosyltransferase
MRVAGGIAVAAALAAIAVIPRVRPARGATVPTHVELVATGSPA